jgi:hypothetical protein
LPWIPAGEGMTIHLPAYAPRPQRKYPTMLIRHVAG